MKKTVKLSSPIEFGGETIEELEIVESCEAFKDFEMKLTGEGEIFYNPHKMAIIGLKMAGKSSALMKKLSVADMNRIASVVTAFLEPGQETGLDE